MATTRRIIVPPEVSTSFLFFFFQAEDGIRDLTVTGVQTCALPISQAASRPGLQVEGAAMGRGDGRHDRQPEPGAVVRTGPVSAEPPERLSELPDLLGVEDVPAGFHHQAGQAPLAPGAGADPAAVVVVRDR